MARRISSRPSIPLQFSTAATAALCAAALLGFAAVPVDASSDGDYARPSDDPSSLAFSVLRKGDVIGSHSIDFTRRGEDLIVDIDIDLELKFAFITLFRYEHSNREVWRGKRLISIDTRTDNNGTEHWISGRAGKKGFEVTSDGGEAILPSDVLPSSYWHPDTRKAKTLLNTQTGALAEINVTPENDESYVPMPWGPQTAQAFKVSGDIDLNLWYDSRGCLLKLNFSAPKDGSLIDYNPAKHLGADGDPSLAGHPLIGVCAGTRLTSAGQDPQ